MDARYAGARTAHLVERRPGARSPRWIRFFRGADAPRALRRVAVLNLLLALACAAPAAASDVYVTNRASSNVSQYDVGAGGALAAKAAAKATAGP